MKRSYLRRIRKERNLTLVDLAKQIGTSRQMIGNVENGYRDPSLTLANKLEDFFGIPQRKLLKRDEENNNEN